MLAVEQDHISRTRLTYTPSVDVKALAGDDIIQQQQPALKKYTEEQFTTVRLPGSSEDVSTILLE